MNKRDKQTKKAVAAAFIDNFKVEARHVHLLRHGAERDLISSSGEEQRWQRWGRPTTPNGASALPSRKPSSTFVKDSAIEALPTNCHRAASHAKLEAPVRGPRMVGYDCKRITETAAKRFLKGRYSCCYGGRNLQENDGSEANKEYE